MVYKNKYLKEKAKQIVIKKSKDKAGAKILYEHFKQDRQTFNKKNNSKI